ncbi:hypothetical protein FKM82_026535 [Ascaphus truei]
MVTLRPRFLQPVLFVRVFLLPSLLSPVSTGKKVCREGEQFARFLLSHRMRLLVKDGPLGPKRKASPGRAQWGQGAKERLLLRGKPPDLLPVAGFWPLDSVLHRRVYILYSMGSQKNTR